MSKEQNSICGICGKTFYKKPSEQNKSISKLVFCSKECYGKYCRHNKICPICGIEFFGTHRKYCSRECSNRARSGMKYFNSQPNNKQKYVNILRQKLIDIYGERCYRCGYCENTNILHVHHKIRKCDKGSDNLDNLELLCPNCHAIEHCKKKG